MQEAKAKNQLGKQRMREAKARKPPKAKKPPVAAERAKRQTERNCECRGCEMKSHKSHKNPRKSHKSQKA